MKILFNKLLENEKIPLLRQLIQWGFLFWCIFLGVQFGLFVGYYESGGQTAYYPRPPGVEAFLPIGALVSLKAWVLSGYFDVVHPAALVLFVTFMGMALLAKKSFCSWICPVGALEESLWRIGQKLFGRSFRVWTWLDVVLRTCKYALLLFFVKIIFLDMPLMAIRGFMKAPYWSIADVKMLHFFTGMSPLAIGVILVLAVLSVFYQNFWCRYLCPYGALLGIISFLSPLKIGRDKDLCTSCGACSRACPARIDVQQKTSVWSVECTGCLTCAGSCPEKGALAMRLPLWKRPLPGWSFALVVLLLFAGGVVAGMWSGHWHTSLTHQDYQRLIPMAERFIH
ncbi:MAG: 4Fe-4S binding protein [Desulfuromonas sp.]|nr:MAG: 4Fe-4S binding protein [Desulfuromonas sp.]